MNQCETILAFESASSAIHVQWADGHRSQFHYVWLRDNCPTIRHPKNGQRMADTITTLAGGANPVSVKLNDAQQVEIVWTADEHKSQFSPAWLRQHCYSNGSQAQPSPIELWDASTLTAPPEAEYIDVSNDEQALLGWLRQFRRYGLAILRGVPAKQDMVLEMGKTLGSFIRGNPWDVKTVINPEYVAYTNLPLAVHMDDSYRDHVPTVHLMHCLVTEVKGGLSTAVDAYKVATVLRERAPTKFELLTTLPIRFRFNSADPRFTYQVDTPLITLNRAGEPETVRMANSHIQPFHVPADLMDAFYDAYLTFCRMCDSDEFQIRYRLNPGDFNMADNHRVMHGRTGFEEGGARHIQGCYIERSDVYGRLNRLEQKYAS